MPDAFVRIRGVSGMVYDGAKPTLTVLLPDGRQTREATSKLSPKPILPAHYGVLFLPLTVGNTSYAWTESGSANNFSSRVAGVVRDPYGPLNSTDSYALIDLERMDLTFPNASGGPLSLNNLTLAPVNGRLDPECLKSTPTAALPLLARATFTAGSVTPDAPKPDCWQMREPDEPLNRAGVENYDLGARVTWSFSNNFSLELASFGGAAVTLEVTTTPANADVPLLLRNLEFPFLLNNTLPGPKSKNPDRDFERLYDLRDPSDTGKHKLIPHLADCADALHAAGGGGRAARCMLGLF